MYENCDHLNHLMKCEISIIRKHLANHKWFNHIEDENAGIEDFIKRYGWLMRELYCGYACEMRDICAVSKKLKGD